MAKINIQFNNSTYSIDESVLSAASAQLQQHLSTVMNGTGASINLNGTTYNIDSAKLSAATNEFVSHLGTIAGNGSKVVVGGAEYYVGSDKVAGAVSDLYTVLSGLHTEDEDEVIEFKTIYEGELAVSQYTHWEYVQSYTDIKEGEMYRVIFDGVTYDVQGNKYTFIDAYEEQCDIILIGNASIRMNYVDFGSAVTPFPDSGEPFAVMPSPDDKEYSFYISDRTVPHTIIIQKVDNAI